MLQTKQRSSLNENSQWLLSAYLPNMWISHKVFYKQNKSSLILSKYSNYLLMIINIILINLV